MRDAPLQPRRRWAGLLTLIAALTAELANAEGAVRVLACTTVQSCDAAGVCEPSQQPVTFRLAPVKLNADGSGQYLLKQDKVDIPLQALSESGPFVWQADAQRHSLLISSDTQLLWHSLPLSGAPASTRFLTCTLQQ